MQPSGRECDCKAYFRGAVSSAVGGVFAARGGNVAAHHRSAFCSRSVHLAFRLRDWTDCLVSDEPGVDS